MALGGSWLIRRLRSISPQPTKQKASSPSPPSFPIQSQNRLSLAYSPLPPQESHYAICQYYSYYATQPQENAVYPTESNTAHLNWN